MGRPAVVARAIIGPLSGREDLVKSITCPRCSVVSSIPDEAKAYKCSNCGALVENVDGHPRAHESANNSPAVKALVLILGGAILFALLFAPCGVLF
jgi:DNA-directed RNA polymerase subunit RPC12/RpoP